MWNRFWLWLHKLLLPGKEVELGSGYDKLHEQRQRIKKLREACLFVITVDKFMSRDVTGDKKPETFCNIAARYIAEAMGCKIFDEGMMANRMHTAMENSDEFAYVDAERAAELAQKGCLVVASRRGDPHGHIAACYPSPPDFSGSWAKKVPIVAHVGRPPNGLKKCSGSFSVKDGEPTYFFWKPSEA